MHLSDVHFGRTRESTVRKLVRSVCDVRPDVVIVSGDLTQRARNHEFARARAFLDDMPGQQIVIPGNHDVPMHNLYARFFQPLDNYRRHISEDIEPSFVDGELAIVSLNTARSLTIKGGRVNMRQVSRVASLLRHAPRQAVRILVSHHPFFLPDEYEKNDLVGRAQMATSRLAHCRIDVFLAGHFHVSYCGGTAERHSLGGYSAVFVQAGTACSDRHRGEPNSFNVLRTGADRLVVETHAMGDSERFHSLPPREFRRTAAGWQPLRQEA